MPAPSDTAVAGVANCSPPDRPRARPRPARVITTLTLGALLPAVLTAATATVHPARVHSVAAEDPAVLPAGDAIHPPPTVYLEVDVLPTAVQIDVVGELQVWNAWLGLDVSGEFLLSDEDIGRIRAGAEAFFAQRNRFAVDGEACAPRVVEVIPPTDFIPGRNIPNVRVRLRLPLDREPRSVGFVWEEFEQTDLFEKKAVPAMVRYRGDVEQAVMTPAEPEYIWHTRVVMHRPPRVDEVTTASARGVTVPLPSVVLVLTGVGLAWVGRRRRWPSLLTPGVLVVGVAAALGLRDVGRVRVPGTGIAVPDGEAAFTIFQRLHGNVYRAFEASTPEEVYDLLAVSVAPHLLDQMYADVYESLVLRGQGGAVCKVEKIDVFERRIEPLQAPSEQPSFAVACGWRVHGVVAHWGHEHRRLNQYKAVYTIAHDGRAWRIGAVDVQEQSRIEENG